MEPWLQSFSGRHILPLSLKPEDICIEDIAHSLSLINRFTGHTFEPWSVGHHSLYVSKLVPDEDKLAALLHDASEAYLQDLPSPLKRLPEFAFYRVAEDNAMRAICQRFGLSDTMPPSVRVADLTMLATECRDCMGGQRGGDWGVLPEPIPEKLYWQPCRIVERMFLDEFERLGGKR